MFFLFLFGLQYGINLSISTLKYVSDTYNPRLISHRLQVAIYFSARFQSFAIKWPRAQAPIHFGLENEIWRQVGPCWRPQLKTISSQHLFKIFELEKEEARASPFSLLAPRPAVEACSGARLLRASRCTTSLYESQPENYNRGLPVDF